MDKKNFLLGIICLFVAFTLFVKQEHNLRESLSQQSVAQEKAPVVTQKSEKVAPAPKVAYKATEIRASQLVTLENDFFKVNFSKIGGAIHSVALKKYPAYRDSQTPYVFNQKALLPALTLVDVKQQPILVNFEVTELKENFIQFKAELSDGTRIVRGYQLPESNAENPYIIKNEFLIDQPTEIRSNIGLFLGSMPGTPGDKYGEFLNFCSYDGKNTDAKRIADFEAGNGFFGIGRHEAQDKMEAQGRFMWGALKNQFFVAILTPNTPADGYLTYPRKTANEDYIEGILKFDLSAGQNRVTSTYYVGPKDYILLDKMGQNQDQLMQFGFFSAVSKLLLMALRGIHSFIPNWGWTIIVLTIIIKLLMWPITQAQLRSSKKMNSIQAPLKLIREKYKNNPQKLQTETMKLFKENRVNPAAGCLPVFVQIPIFIGLYYMLRTSSEIRFQSFLWIQDLSVPDTIAMLGTFPVNILPLLMGITMFVQMKLTPTPSMDGMQQKIIMAMPFIFLIFCYNFPAALVLYWTIQNLFTIFQQWLTHRYLNDEQPQTVKH